MALADPVEDYGNAAESAKRWVEDLSAQVSPVMVHSHNDYLRPRPLFSALSVGCASVEADVWLSYLAARVSRQLNPNHVKGFVALSSILITIYFFIDVYA